MEAPVVAAGTINSQKADPSLTTPKLEKRLGARVLRMTAANGTGVYNGLKINVTASCETGLRGHLIRSNYEDGCVGSGPGCALGHTF